jgi:hypothetical protein
MRITVDPGMLCRDIPGMPLRNFSYYFKRLQINIPPCGPLASPLLFKDIKEQHCYGDL